jgi:tetratricopeptide (TPR) repeat protein
MARVLESEGDDPGAASFRTRAIKVLDIQKDFYRVGELYMRSGNRPEALKNYVRAADKGDVTAMVKAADLFYVTGKPDRARVYYKKAINKGIKDPKILQWTDYQYGKLAKDDEYLNKAKAGGGIVAEAAELMKSSR